MDYHIEDIIVQVKNRLALVCSSITDVQNWEIGILPEVPKFPVVTILPVSQLPLKYYSGGLYIEQYSFDIEIYSRGVNLSLIKLENQRITSLLEQHLRNRDFFTFEDYVFNTVIDGPITLNQDVSGPGETHKVISSIIRIKLYRKQQVNRGLFLNVAGSYSVDENNDDVINLTNKLQSLFEDYRTTYKTETLGISELRNIYTEELDEYTVIPCLLIQPPTLSKVKKFAGREESTYSYTLRVITKALPQRASLIEHLELTTKLHQLIQLYQKLSLNDNGLLSATYVSGETVETQYQSRIIDNQWIETKFLLDPNRMLYVTEINCNVIAHNNYSITLPTLIGVSQTIMTPAANYLNIISPFAPTLGTDFTWDGLIEWPAIPGANKYVMTLRYFFTDDLGNASDFTQSRELRIPQYLFSEYTRGKSGTNSSIEVIIKTYGVGTEAEMTGPEYAWIFTYRLP